MTPQWIVALASAIVGALITIGSQAVTSLLTRRRMKAQLLRQLRLEIETARRIAQDLGAEDSTDTVRPITLPTVTTQLLLTTGLLHPIRERTLVTALLTYWALSNDVQRAVFHDVDLETFREWILHVVSDIESNAPDRGKRRRG